VHNYASRHLAHIGDRRRRPCRARRRRGQRGGRPRSGRPGRGRHVYADVIKEIDASGTVTWSWRAAEHLDPALYPLQPHYRREHWPLINGVCPLADGTVAASLRSVSAVIIIDRATGEIIWRLGPDTVAQQHCPSELRPCRCRWPAVPWCGTPDLAAGP
jgi:hypothetical protein